MTQLQPGDPAPAFTLSDAGMGNVSLADYAGRRVSVYFFPAAMTPGCSLEAMDFDAAMGDLAAAGYEVVGISPDNTDKLARFAARDRLRFPLLADPGAASVFAPRGQVQLASSINGDVPEIGLRGGALEPVK